MEGADWIGDSARTEAAMGRDAKKNSQPSVEVSLRESHGRTLSIAGKSLLACSLVGDFRTLASSRNCYFIAIRSLSIAVTRSRLLQTSFHRHWCCRREKPTEGAQQRVAGMNVSEIEKAPGANAPGEQRHIVLGSAEVSGLAVHSAAKPAEKRLTADARNQRGVDRAVLSMLSGVEKRCALLCFG